MKKYAIALLLLLYFLSTNATNYYLSSTSGSDLNDGKTPNTAWQSITKLKTVLTALQPGDSVLFKGGDAFSGQLVLSKSGTVSKNIYFGSYGSGKKPIISGTVSVKNWNQTSTNIWEATCAEAGSKVSNFFINGIPQQIGRWPNASDPNKGYLSYETHSGTNQITDKDLSDAINWTGAEAVVRRVRWILDRLTIKSQTSGTLQFTTNVGYEFLDGFGYFIQNDLRTLDQQGEWFFQPTTKKFSLYSETDPNKFITEAAKLDNLIKLSTVNDVTIENIQFVGSGKLSLQVQNCNRLTLRNLEIKSSGENGVDISSSNNVLFESNLINHTNNNAFIQNGCKKFVMRGNTIKNTALIAGMGLGSDGQYNAVQFSGTNILAENNLIDSVGYIGFNFSGDTVLIKNNVISNYCMTKDDGGGLYTWNDGKTINHSRKLIGNVLLNAIGAPEGSAWPGVASEGIYIDDRSANVDIIGNTVYNCGNNGIFIHNANHINVRGNTFYNNGKQFWMVHDNIAPAFPITDCVVDSNILVSRDANQLVAKFQTIDNGISNQGTFESNWYCRPLDDKLVIQTEYVNGTSVSEALTLEAWQTKYQKDQHSGKSPVAVDPYKILAVKSPNLFTNSAFEVSTSGWSMWANYNNAKIAIAKGEGVPGNAMKASFTAASGKTDGYMIVITNAIKLSAGKSYRLKFSARCSNPNVSISLIPRKNGDPYNNVADTKSFVVGTTYNAYEFLLEPTMTENNSRIDFQIREGQGDVWFDNMELVEVDVEQTNPDDYILFEYNATETDKTISIPDEYADVKGNPVSGSLILKPFTSVILFKKPATSIGFLPESIDPDLNIYPNPASSQLTIKSKNEIRSVSMRNMNGQLLSSFLCNGCGEYTIYNLPKSGLYFLQVETYGKTEFKKLVIAN
jgi:parallel beta-helix repeat protein